MSRMHPLTAALAAAALAAACAKAPESDTETPPADAGPQPIVLWDGGALDGWSMAGPGEFVVEDGALKTTGGMGLLWYSAREFDDFELELEWKVDDASDNSGVFVRFPDPGDDPWVAVNQGYELQICDTGGDKGDTGSVYSFQGPSATASKAPGEWNQYRIRAVGEQYTLWVNGEQVNDFTGERGTRGYIGLQNHGDADAVYFRKVRVTPL